MKVQFLKIIKSLIKSPYTVMGIIGGLALALPAQGFCANGGEIEEINNSLTNLLSHSGLRTTAILAGGGVGMVRMVQTGSVTPLFKWVGVGIAMAFIAKIATFLGGLGAS